MSEILVITENDGNGLNQSGREALSCAVTIAGLIDGSIKLVHASHKNEDRASAIAVETGLDVIDVEGENLASYSSEGYIQAVAHIFQDEKPLIICIPGTSRGNDFAPALAVRLHCRYIPGVNRIRREKNELIYTRTCWYGKLETDIRPGTGPLVITVQPGSFPAKKDSAGTGGTVRRVPLNIALLRTKSIGAVTESETDSADLRSAEVIVSAGRGLLKEENLKLLYRLAALYPRSAIGATRPVCDYGWLPYSRQIGQTGKTVAPKLYIACGISGSLQHLAGMKGSEHIVAINLDPDAPIFMHTDAGIVEDLVPFIDAFISIVDENKGK